MELEKDSAVVFVCGAEQRGDDVLVAVREAIEGLGKSTEMLTGVGPMAGGRSTFALFFCSRETDEADAVRQAAIDAAYAIDSNLDWAELGYHKNGHLNLSAWVTLRRSEIRGDAMDDGTRFFWALKVVSGYV